MDPNDTKRGTFLIKAKSTSPPYIHCNSSLEYQSPSSLPSITTDSCNHTTPIKLPIDIVQAVPTASSDEKKDDSTLNQSPPPPRLSAKQVNQTLNLHLGLPFDPRKSKLVRIICQILDKLLLLIEASAFSSMESIPLSLRQSIVLLGWKLYFPFHKWTLSNRTGIHEQVSYEYHALTTIMYWGRVFPVNLRRIRFSLSQLCNFHGPSAYPPNRPLASLTPNSMENAPMMMSSSSSSPNNKVLNVNGGYIETVPTLLEMNLDGISFSIHIDMDQKTILTPPKDSGTEINTQTIVSGYYIQHGASPSKKVILWLFGGAYLGGDAKGNSCMAEKIGQQCNYSDVFLPQYRLLPENKFVDALHDVVQAYEYLVTIRGVHPEDITLFGISSGGGLCVRLMQRIAEYRRIAAKDKDAKVNPLLELMPSGAVLMCPFVDYTIPPGSFREYTKHDLIVNDSVMEEGLPYFATQGDADFLRANSPVYRPLDGLPPLCIVVSEHEACYDQIVLLCNNARAAGVEVDLGVWKYMCHVFSVLSAFIPEAQDSVDFMCEWIKENSMK